MLCATFSGCASLETLPPKRDVIGELRIVEVPTLVKVPCVSAKDIPERPKPAQVDIDNASERQVAAAAAAYMLELKSYADAADIVLWQCATVTEATK